MNRQPLASAICFTVTALLSFSVWAFGQQIFPSEPAMYAFCALVFFGLGGLSLGPAAGVKGAREFFPFALRFGLGFAAYAVVWSVAWFTFRNTFGEVIGASLGLLALVWVLKPGVRKEPGGLTGATALVFLCHSLGYYTGGFAYESLQNRGLLGVPLPFEGDTVVTLARLSWGLFYGLGLGCGLARLVQRRN